MTNKILVSIIIPVFNADTYLRQCLDSAINQTLKNIEIICINDCSDDDSLSILQEYAQKDSRITVVSNFQKSGAGFCRNKGIRMAKGKFLHFMDADDFIQPEAMELAVFRAESTNADIVIFDVNVISDKKYNEFYFCKDGYFNTATPDTFDYKYLKDKMLTALWNIWNKLYRTEFVKKNNIEYQNTRVANDIAFHVHTTIKAERITYIKNKFYNYRFAVPNSITFNNNNKRYLDIYNVLLRIKEILTKENLFDFFNYEYYSFALDQISKCLRIITHHKNRTLFIKRCKKLFTGINKEVLDRLNYNNQMAYLTVMSGSGNRHFYARKIMCIIRSTIFW